MPAAAGSPLAGFSPAGSGDGFSTPQTGRDLIHAAQLDQLREKLGQLEESFTGFGEELKAALPGLPSDEALLARSRRELASLAMRLCDSAHNDRILTLLSRRDDGPGAKVELLGLVKAGLADCLEVMESIAEEGRSQLLDATAASPAPAPPLGATAGATPVSASVGARRQICRTVGRTGGWAT